MKSSEQFPLEDEVHVDEFEIGTPQKGEQDRSKSDKKMRIVIAFEHREGKSGRGYAKVIEDYSTKSLKPLFDTHIKNDASILADEWSGYNPIKEEYADLKQTLSDKGKNFKCYTYKLETLKIGLKEFILIAIKNILKNTLTNISLGLIEGITEHQYWTKYWNVVQYINL